MNNANQWIRHIHRWLSIAFTVTVIVTMIALAREQPAVWMSYVPLLPLGFLLVTGLHLFVLPYGYPVAQPATHRRSLGVSSMRHKRQSLEFL